MSAYIGQRSKTQRWRRSVEPIEVIQVQAERVACDGGGSALGHPRVFLSIGPGGEVVCPYCSRKFIKAQAAEPTSVAAD